MYTQRVRIEDSSAAIWTADVNFIAYNYIYGQDADGNRGVWRTRVEVKSIEDYEKDGIPVKDKDVPEDIKKKFEEADLDIDRISPLPRR